MLEANHELMRTDGVDDDFENSDDNDDDDDDDGVDLLKG